MTPAGFPHSDIPGSLDRWLLPRAFRSLARPSSAPAAKASTECSCSLAVRSYFRCSRSLWSSQGSQPPRRLFTACPDVSGWFRSDEVAGRDSHPSKLHSVPMFNGRTPRYWSHQPHASVWWLPRRRVRAKEMNNQWFTETRPTSSANGSSLGC